jgi:hypothetical protein
MIIHAMKSHLILLTVCLLLLNILSYAQLSGEYTVGGSGSNFPTIQSASDAVVQLGINGPVTFKIRPGTYDGFTLNAFENQTEQDTLCFEPENEEVSSVIITSRIVLNHCNRVKLNQITILASESQIQSSILLEETNHCLLNGCEISNPDGQNYDYNEALINIGAPWDGSMLRLTIKNCSISSLKEIILISGKKTNIYFQNNDITGILTTGGYNNKYFTNNVILILNTDFADGGQNFTGNSIYTTDPETKLNITGKFVSNVFFCHLNVGGSIFQNNIFHGDVEILHGSSPRFTNNVFMDDFKSTYSHNGWYSNNVFHGVNSINSDANRFWNNIFFGDIEITHGPGQWIVHNNFHPDATLSTLYIGGIIENNNLGHLSVLQPAITDVRNNNFVGTSRNPTEYTGRSPFFYDPGYGTDTSMLRATNPALIHKSTPIYSVFKYDLDSTLRKPIPTIGAHEICVDFNFDTITLSCSDSLKLELCYFDSLNYYWSPSWVFADSTSPSPLIRTPGNVVIQLNDKELGVIDSLLIQTSDIMPVAGAQYVIDAFNVQFYSFSGCADAHQWEFGDGYTSADRNPLHVYEQAGLYFGRLIVTNDIGADANYFSINIVNPTIEEMEKEMIHIFPNPVLVNIYFEAPQDEFPILAELYNLQGVLVKTFTIQNTKRNINVSEMAAGLYSVRLNTLQRSSWKRIIIVK